VAGPGAGSRPEALCQDCRFGPQHVLHLKTSHTNGAATNVTANLTFIDMVKAQKYRKYRIERDIHNEIRLLKEVDREYILRLVLQNM
jgi:hypothetical protein